MGITRRQFLHLVGASGLGVTVLSSDRSAQAAAQVAGLRANATLIDIARCIGCRSCEAACKANRGFPAGESSDLSTTAWTYLRLQPLRKPVPHATLGDGMAEQRAYKVQCMHCLEPACASACPVAALRKTPEGPVVYDAGRCIGCRYCMLACAFQVPRYQWDKPLPVVTKCDYCAERLAQGKVPACVEACPAEALQYGPRHAMLAEAARRIAGDPKRYVPEIYGDEEVGGTSVLYISDVPFEELGFRAVVREPLPAYTWKALGKIPGLVVGLGATLTALEVVIRKRNEQMARAGGGSDGR